MGAAYVIVVLFKFVMTTYIEIDCIDSSGGMAYDALVLVEVNLFDSNKYEV